MRAFPYLNKSFTQDFLRSCLLYGALSPEILSTNAEWLHVVFVWGGGGGACVGVGWDYVISAVY